MPHNKKKSAVRIVNPVSGSGWTSHRRAKQFIDDGRARRVPGGIEFINGDPRHSAVCRRAVEDDYSRAAHSGFAGIDELRNLPMVGPVERMLIERGKRAA